MRELVRRWQFVITTHADEEADADDFSVFDIESAILTGRIVQRQKDADSGDWKYVVSGQCVDGRPICVVARIGSTRRALYIITVYAE